MSKETYELGVKQLREAQTTADENSAMHAFNEALVCLTEIKKEMEDFPNKDSEIFKIKLKRYEVLTNSMHSFYECFFNMSKYKERANHWKYKYIDSEMQYLNLVDSLQKPEADKEKLRKALK